jgi:hypothetical protein
MRRADHVDAIDLQQPQSPNGIAQMPEGGAPRTLAIESLRRQSQTPRLGERKRSMHGSFMLPDAPLVAPAL